MPGYLSKLYRKRTLTGWMLHIFILGTGNPEAQMQNIRKPRASPLLSMTKVFFFDAGEGAFQTAAGLGLPYEANLQKSL